MKTTDINSALTAVCPGYGALDEAELVSFAVDNVIPRAAVSPDSVESLSAVVRFAWENNLSVIPRGAGTKMNLGMPPSRADLVISLENLNRVKEYESADMTASVEAGISLHALQTHLLTEHQFFPMDPPYSDRCTLGGILATNAFGSLRWTHGTSRDLVIGTRVVQADGTVVKGGGKVVKNVAGYDINKMYIGSLGTLGIIVEATVKVQPLPETEEAVLGRFSSISAASEAARRVLDSEIMPAYVEVGNPVPIAILSRRAGGGLGDSGFALIIGACGPKETVVWQMSECRKLCESAGAIQVTSIRDSLYGLTHEVLQEFPTGQAVPRGMLPGIVSTVSMAPDDTEHIYVLAEDLCRQKAIGCGMLSHFGNGAMTLVFFREQAFDGEDLANLCAILKELMVAAERMNGALTLTHCPLALKDEINIWGESRGEWNIMKLIKDKFDPRHILNPGRFVHGI
ncbi:MAG: FAD-binding oxidoreductase [Candidatus Latescibacteria bacterium]|nr:FAD-binding oxidoreductase [Candidatus Latescibacterota bacterium]